MDRNPDQGGRGAEPRAGQEGESTWGERASSVNGGDEAPERARLL